MSEGCAYHSVLKRRAPLSLSCDVYAGIVHVRTKDGVTPADFMVSLSKCQ